MRILSVVLILISLPSFLAADTIWKKDGSKLTGKVLAEEKDRVQVLVKMGSMEAKIWIARADIHRIERGLTPAEEFEERLLGLDPADLEGHRALLSWAKRKRLAAAMGRLKKRLPEVERRQFLKQHPRTWCRTCDATGRVPCRGCLGKGVTVNPCERCEGEGKIPCRVCLGRPDARLRCRRCSGEGKIERFDPKQARKRTVTCPDCKGHGDHDCPRCKGERSQQCPLCKGEKGLETACEVCGGEEPHRICPTCNGSRLQPTPLTDEELAREAEERAKREADAKAKADAAARAKKEAEKEKKKQATKDGKQPTRKPDRPESRPGGDRRRD